MNKMSNIKDLSNDLQIYYFEKGKHDGLPNDQPRFTWSNIVETHFRMTPTMYFDFNNKDEYPYGSYDGWNKGFGLTDAFSTNNRRSAMWAWFPSKKNPGKITIAAYTNNRKGNWDAKVLAEVDYWDYVIRIHWNNDKATFWMRPLESEEWIWRAEMPLKDPPWWTGWMALIFGGNKRGLGPWYGGQYPAFKDMHFFANSTY